MNTRAVLFALAALLAVPAADGSASTSLLNTQESGNDESEPPRDVPPLLLNVGAQVEHRPGTDLDDGGEVETTSFDMSVGGRLQLSEQWTVSTTFGYSFDHYSFADETALGADPWGDVHHLRLRPTLTYRDPNLTIFGGPIFSVARETGADWGDSFTMGGIAGVRLPIGDGGSLGLGVGVVDQLEDSARFFPVITFDLGIAEDLRLSTRPGGGGPGGIELIWSGVEHLEIALGARYETTRFRLDEDGPEPGGVGEVSSVPVWLRLGYQPNEQVQADVYGGVNARGRYKLDDRDGNRIADDDTDPGIILGASVRVFF